VFSLLWDCRLLYLFIFVKCDEWDIFLGFSSQHLYLHFFNNGPLVDISLYFVTAFCTKPWFFVLTPQSCVLNGKATHINFIVFGLTQPEMEPVLYHTLSEHTAKVQYSYSQEIWRVTSILSKKKSLELFTHKIISVIGANIWKCIYCPLRKRQRFQLNK
jgi:hypothetical protein